MAEAHLKEVRSDRQRIKSKILSLATAPKDRGYRLHGDLSHLHSIRAGQYRIIYKVVEELNVVFVKLVGLRREGERHDVYKRASRLFGR